MGQLVDIRAIGAVLAPPDTPDRDQTLAHAAVEAGVADMFAPGVEDAHRIAVGNVAAGHILGVQFQQGPLLGLAQAGARWQVEFMKLRAGGEIMASG